MLYVHLKTGRTIKRGQFKKLYQRYFTLESLKGNQPTEQDFMDSKGFIESKINLNY